MTPLRIALAQLDPVVGDLDGNRAKILAAWRESKRRGDDLVITAELCITGYPPEDLVHKPSFIDAVEVAVAALARDTADGPALLLGAPWRLEGKTYNAALLLEGGSIVGKSWKHDLPNYACYDEKRVFAAGPLPEPLVWRGLRLGVLICEDMWKPPVARHLRHKAAQILIVLNGSPFETDKRTIRHAVARERARESGLPLVYVNQYGGQDELVFDGASFVMDAAGELCAEAEAWTETLLSVTCAVREGDVQPQAAPIMESSPHEESVYNALVTGLRDYVTKNGFAHVLLGLSGGIDSALVAAIAVDALGADKVQAVMMPSPYTSADSLRDAAACAAALGCRLDSIAITPAMLAFDEALKPLFAGKTRDIAEENIQARCRGVLLMALSNKSGGMVLATGNKSEMAVGYATLYGDMCGGYAPLKDVYKTEVYRLARWRNGHKPRRGLGPSGVVVAETILTKAPTAELRPNQTDQDSLPPYDTLDAILACLIEGDGGMAACVTAGHDKATVAQVWRMLDRAEYKRRQSPPGPKITRRHLGRERRYPITNRYVE